MGISRRSNRAGGALQMQRSEESVPQICFAVTK